MSKLSILKQKLEQEFKEEIPEETLLQVYRFIFGQDDDLKDYLASQEFD